MSGYTDEPRDYNDRDRRPPTRREDEEDVALAKKRVSVPAVGLIVVGALTLIASIGGLIQLRMGQFDVAVDDMVKQIQADPNLPAAQKQDQIQMLNNIRDVFNTYGPPFYATGALVGVIVLVGGIRFKVLGSPGLVVISSLLAVLPFSACCLLGMLFGIWALVSLSSFEVKAGFAAKRRLAATSPDERYE